MTTAIWWIRRDLRLADNQALTAALNHAGQIIPLFIFDPALLNSPFVGQKRLAFLLAGLRQLDADLQQRGSGLLVRRGNPAQELARLRAETDAAAIFAEEDYSPYARRRDEEIARQQPLQLVDGLTVYHPSTISKDDGEPYVVYTPFSKSWKAISPPTASALLPAPAHIPTPPNLPNQPIPDEPALPASVPFTPGQAEAQQRLKQWLRPAADSSGSIQQYAGLRNRVDRTGTAQLSPYLRFGMLSARQAAVAALKAIEAAPSNQARKGAQTWLNELIWREFYIAILYHFPHVRGRSFREKYDEIDWQNDETAFAAWCEGRTGYPVVDAAMRQLVQTGWMHNRARMIVASFLVKDLLIDWRWGERFFMKHLVDGDPAANNGGWQWTAGTGTDAAPYFRIFNPTLQAEKFDPQGVYIRQWLPELADVPDRFIHAPQKMPPQIQRQAGCIIGQDYPKPIVDHKQAREQTLAAYSQVK